MIQDIKQNINKIDFDLKQLFENVYISDKIEKNNFLFDISVNKMFLFEGCKKRVEVKVNINKNDLNSNIIKWSYLLNPLNENEGKIERISYVQTIASDIYDIAANKRMVNEYFNQLEDHVDLICEDFNPSGCLPNGGLNMVPIKIREIANIVYKYAKVARYTPYEKYVDFTISEDMVMLDKFNLEKELIDSEKANYISFQERNIKVTLK